MTGAALRRAFGNVAVAAKWRTAMRTDPDAQAMQMALDALAKIADLNGAYGAFPETNALWRGMAIVTARESLSQLRERLAQPAPEPVAYVNLSQWRSGLVWPNDCFSEINDTQGESDVPLYTAPPAALDGIRMGLEAAAKACTGLAVPAVSVPNEVIYIMSAHDCAEAIRALDPATIAKEGKS
jgi:hypothetical protein